jgi:hypothetical protein
VQAKSVDHFVDGAIAGKGDHGVIVKRQSLCDFAGVTPVCGIWSWKLIDFVEHDTSTTLTSDIEGAVGSAKDGLDRLHEDKTRFSLPKRLRPLGCYG